jgi:hypothetical protein
MSELCPPHTSSKASHTNLGTNLCLPFDRRKQAIQLELSNLPIQSKIRVGEFLLRCLRHQTLGPIPLIGERETDRELRDSNPSNQHCRAMFLVREKSCLDYKRHVGIAR